MTYERIITWITYKGKRIPIRESLFKGIKFVRRADTESLLKRLSHSSPHTFKGLVPYKGKIDWKWLAAACRDTDKKFPGLLENVEVHFFSDTEKRKLKGFALSTDVGKRKIAYYRQIISELEKSKTSQEKFIATAKKFHLIPYGVKELDENFVNFLQELAEHDLKRSLRSYYQNKKLLGDRNYLFMNPALPARNPSSYVKTEKDVWIHEFGHLLMGKISNKEFEAWNIIYERQRNRIQSTYGRSNPSEGFAEEFLLYIKTGKCSTNAITLYFETLERSWNFLE